MESSLMCEVVYGGGTLTLCFTHSGIDDVNHNSKLIEEVVLQKDFCRNCYRSFRGQVQDTSVHIFQSGNPFLMYYFVEETKTVFAMTVA